MKSEFVGDIPNWVEIPGFRRTSGHLTSNSRRTNLPALPQICSLHGVERTG